MTRLLLAALILSVLTGVILWQRSELRATRADLAHTSDLLAEAELRAEAEAALRTQAEALHLAAVKRMAADAEKWAAAEVAVRSQEGADAPASDYLRSVVSGLVR